MPAKIRFGTDGWRAVIGKEFTLRNVEAVAQAIADYLTQTTDDKRQTTKVAVGYDTRRLSPQAARCISGVLAANRIPVFLAAQPLPTQAISYAVRSGGLAAGIMVTASHNPPHFNGIKLKRASGGTAQTALTDKIERLLFQQPVKKISLAQARRKGLLKTVNFIPGYLSFLNSYLDMPLLKKAHLHILVDAMHGTANSYMARILQDTPCKVTTIHQLPDASFGGIKPEPLPSCLREAAALMRKGRFALGLATDGDADRIAALDERGRFINPQKIIALLSLHLIRYRGWRGAVVKTISGSALLESIARKYKLKLYETPVGFKHISALMHKRDVLIGGEEGGGIGFKHYLPERDGILAGLLLVEMMCAWNKSIAALIREMQREFGPFFYLRKDLNCPAGQKERMRRRLAWLRKSRRFSGLKIKRVQDYDGLKFCLAERSWVLFRLSGTEPILRIYAESDSLVKTRRLIAEGEKLLWRDNTSATSP